MKFLTDDDRFGIVVTPTGYRHMYQFRLVINGQLIGDTEPCIIGSAILGLGDLKALGDPRLSLGVSEPEALVRLVRSISEMDIESGEEPADADLHDGIVLSLAESLDSWLVLGFRHDRSVVFLASQDQASGTLGPVTAAVIEASAYDPLVETVRMYWAELEAAAGPGYGPSVA